MAAYALLTTVSNQPGILLGLTRVLADYSANITYIDIIEHRDRDAQIYLEFSAESAVEPLVADLGAVPGVARVEVTPSFSKIYGKRVIIMGGGAQVGQVALGAITEADRHNIRGERISVDTIPLVGEEALASAVRAVVRAARLAALPVDKLLALRRARRVGWQLGLLGIESVHATPPLGVIGSVMRHGRTR